MVSGCAVSGGLCLGLACGFSVVCLLSVVPRSCGLAGSLQVLYALRIRPGLAGFLV